MEAGIAMKVILRDNIDKLGKLGEVVEVKEGYARNYLIPRQLAYRCTADAERLRAVRHAVPRRRPGWPGVRVTNGDEPSYGAWSWRWRNGSGPAAEDPSPAPGKRARGSAAGQLLQGGVTPLERA